MAQAFDWRNDPIVQIEQQVEHVVPLCAMWLTDLALDSGADYAALHAELITHLEQAETCFYDAGTTMFAPMNVKTPKEIASLCARTAGVLGKFSQQVTSLGDHPEKADVTALNAQLRTEIRPAIQSALNGLRATFISAIVQRQTLQKKQATLAIKQVREISKKIFFISINASVEAARVGDAGKGFSMISQEIRSLSQTAKAAVDDLSNATD
jgi:hypothetical protein